MLCIATLLASCGSSRKAGSSTYSGNSGNSAPVFLKTEQVLATIINPALKQQVTEWMGVPYKYGGNTKKGTDCSGFITQVFVSVFNKKLPRSAAQMHAQASSVKASRLQEGDLVFFKINSAETSHAGIYLNNGYFVHASTSRGVMISNLEEAYWKRYFDSGGSLL